MEQLVNNNHSCIRRYHPHNFYNHRVQGIRRAMSYNHSYGGSAQALGGGGGGVVSTSSPVTMDQFQQSRGATEAPGGKSRQRLLRSSQPGRQQKGHTSQQQHQQSQNLVEPPADSYLGNNYSNNYIHTGESPISYIRNVKNTVEGYPKLQRLFQLKESQVDENALIPYGCRVDIDTMIPTLKKWIFKDHLAFDVIMIGSLTENQFIYPLLSELPLEKLCSKPGFLFIWASSQKINELTNLLNNDKKWGKKFRRSEELVFVAVDKESPYYPGKNSADEEAVFEKMQWHCWMCITGTVRRSTDSHLIHCNVDTDLTLEALSSSFSGTSEAEKTKNTVVPNQIYKVAENFSTSQKRLHIIPSRCGFSNVVRPRRGWVIMSPDIIIDNFDPSVYKSEIEKTGANLERNDEIENLRPKSPAPRPHKSSF